MRLLFNYQMAKIFPKTCKERGLIGFCQGESQRAREDRKQDEEGKWMAPARRRRRIVLLAMSDSGVEHTGVSQQQSRSLNILSFHPRHSLFLSFGVPGPLTVPRQCAAHCNEGRARRGRKTKNIQATRHQTNIRLSLVSPQSFDQILTSARLVYQSPDRERSVSVG